MASKIKISMDDKKYQAKWDLDTLKQAKEIMANKARLSAAQNAAKEQMNALNGIINTNTKKPVAKKK